MMKLDDEEQIMPTGVSGEIVFVQMLFEVQDRRMFEFNFYLTVQVFLTPEWGLHNGVNLRQIIWSH